MDTAKERKNDKPGLILFEKVSAVLIFVIIMYSIFFTLGLTLCHFRGLAFPFDSQFPRIIILFILIHCLIIYIGMLFLSLNSSGRHFYLMVLIAAPMIVIIGFLVNSSF